MDSNIRENFKEEYRQLKHVQGHDLRDTVLYIDPNFKCHKSDERCDDVPLEKDFSIELHALYPIDTLMHSPNTLL